MCNCFTYSPELLSPPASNYLYLILRILHLSFHHPAWLLHLSPTRYKSLTCKKPWTMKDSNLRASFFCPGWHLKLSSSCNFFWRKERSFFSLAFFFFTFRVFRYFQSWKHFCGSKSYEGSNLLWLVLPHRVTRINLAQWRSHVFLVQRCLAILAFHWCQMPWTLHRELCD